MNMPKMTISRHAAWYIVKYAGSDVVLFRSTVRAYATEYIKNNEPQTEGATQ